MTKTFTRRDFLKTAGLTLGASTLLCCGSGYLASMPPAVDTPSETYGEKPAMNDKILLTYATRAGSTPEIAAALAKSLSERGYTVDVKPVKEKPSLAGYQAVLLGSAIRMGSWLPEAVDFIKQNQATLNALQVALFTVHMLNDGDDEASKAARLAYLDAVRPLLQPAAEVYFTGKMDFSRLSFLDRMVSRFVKAVEADRRDWDKIHAWGQAVFA
jgi:menaquinone-dependent protoporphyrinogen oxidase